MVMLTRRKTKKTSGRIRTGPAPSETQLELLNFLSDSRQVMVHAERVSRGQPLARFATLTGREIAGSPQINTASVSACQKRGWIRHANPGTAGPKFFSLTDAGKAIRKQSR